MKRPTYGMSCRQGLLRVEMFNARPLWMRFLHWLSTEKHLHSSHAQKANLLEDKPLCVALLLAIPMGIFQGVIVMLALEEYGAKSGVADSSDPRERRRSASSLPPNKYHCKAGRLMRCTWHLSTRKVASSARWALFLRHLVTDAD